MSLHCRSRQRSNYIRVDDNPTNFDFQKNIFSFLYDNKQLSDEKIHQMKDELNRIHIKFSGEEEAHIRRRRLIHGQNCFHQQLVNLRNKSLRLNLAEKVDNLVQRNFTPKSFEEYQFNKQFTA